MEAKVIDFKQSVKPSFNVKNRQDLLKDKGFSSTLESVNNKNNNSKESSHKPIKSNSDKSSNAVIGDEETKTDIVEPLEKEIDEKDYTKTYEGVIFSLVNVQEILIDSENNEEYQLNLNGNTEEIISVNDIENTFKLDEQLEVPEVNNNSIEMNDQNNKENIEEFKLIEVSNFNNNDGKVGISKIDSKVESKVLLNKTDSENNEELAVSSEKDSLYTNQTINDKDSNNLEQNFNPESFTPEQENEPMMLKSSKDDLDINNKSFIPFEKDGIRFVDNNTIKSENPDLIDKKDLIEQIVHKMKIDLTESKNEIKIRLKPEVLGEMMMNIEVVKGEITAKIMVDNLRTKEIIEGNLIQLKEGIKDTGLEIKTFEVFVGNGSDFDKHNSSQFNLKQNSKKIRIKVQDNKTVSGYGENPLGNGINSIDAYSENSLNLFA